jgi:hypothetical protein
VSLQLTFKTALRISAMHQRAPCSKTTTHFEETARCEPPAHIQNCPQKLHHRALSEPHSQWRKASLHSRTSTPLTYGTYDTNKPPFSTFASLAVATIFDWASSSRD